MSLNDRIHSPRPIAGLDLPSPRDRPTRDVYRGRLPAWSHHNDLANGALPIITALASVVFAFAGVVAGDGTHGHWRRLLGRIATGAPIDQEADRVMREKCGQK